MSHIVRWGGEGAELVPSMLSAQMNSFSLFDKRPNLPRRDLNDLGKFDGACRGRATTKPSC